MNTSSLPSQVALQTEQAGMPCRLRPAARPHRACAGWLALGRREQTRNKRFFCHVEGESGLGEKGRSGGRGHANVSYIIWYFFTGDTVDNSLGIDGAAAAHGCKAIVISCCKLW